MLKQPITYTDYNGVTRTEDFFFNLDKLEIMELEIQFEGGLTGKINELMQAQAGPEVYNLFKEIILKAYGKKSADGRRFQKGDDIALEFVESPAMAELIFSFLKDADAAAEFIRGVLPSQATIDKIKADFEEGMLSATTAGQGQQVPSAAEEQAGNPEQVERKPIGEAPSAENAAPKPEVIADAPAEVKKEKYEDYTEEELMALPIEQFHALLPSSPTEMSRDQLLLAMKRRNEAPNAG